MRIVNAGENSFTAVEATGTDRLLSTEASFRYYASEQVLLRPSFESHSAEPGLPARLGAALGEFARAYAESWSYAYGSPPPLKKSVLYRRAAKRVAARRRAAS